MRVLIVEDSESVALMLAEYLRPIADEVIIAGTLEQAMNEIKKVDKFDIMTLDLGLPDSTSGETIAQVRAIKDHNPDCLLVIITGIVNPCYEASAMKLGADGFIAKIGAVSGGQGTFLHTLRNIALSCIRVPKRYQKNIAILEELAQRVADHFPPVEGAEKRLFMPQ